jgi:BirA family biotin operon repressor/biotin-[acetyl-CoA-carboxylase] ligase
VLKENILAALERRKGELVTGGELAASLGVSRTAVWKAIRGLRGDGHEIVSLANSGYRLEQTDDVLSARAIRERLTTAFMGRELILLPTVHSTNRYLKELHDAPDGCVVIADEQTAGRGRRERAFLSPKSGGVYMSVLLRPKLSGAQDDIRLLTICAAAAVSQAIENICGVKAEIKWVNDVFCGGKKICGILTEAVLTGELFELSSVIIGIGINTAQVPAEIGGIATSIREAADLRGVRNKLAAETLNRLEAVYDCFLRGETARKIIPYYESRLFIKGRSVTVQSTEERFCATVEGIGETGALIVRDSAGDLRHITSGEIKL